MKSIKLFIILILTSLLATAVNAQDKRDRFIKKDIKTVLRIPAGSAAAILDSISEGSNDTLLKTIYNIAVRNDNMKEFAKLFRLRNETLILKNSAVFVATRNGFKDGKWDYSSVHSTILHQRGLQKEWSEYLLGSKRIALIFFGETTDYKNLKITNDTSFTESSFRDLVSLVQAIWRSAKIEKIRTEDSTTVDLPVRLVLLKRSKIFPPSTVSFAAPVKGTAKEKLDYQHPIKVTTKKGDLEVTYDVPINSAEGQSILNGKPTEITSEFHPVGKTVSSYDTIRIKLHDRNHFAFSIGAGASKFYFKNYTLEDKKLTVTLDDSAKKEWVEKLTAEMEYYPFGRDIERFEPIWKNPLNRPFERVGIFGGLQISKDPLNALFAGFTVALAKGANFNLGWTWQNEVVEQQFLTNLTSIDEARKYLKRSYSPAHFYFGISVAPSEMMKGLGLGGDGNKSASKQPTKK